MKRYLRKLITGCLVTFGVLGSVSTYAQRTWSSASYVPVNINSGNPTFPYPQFLEYKVGKTLAKYNAEGVTHADMEKTGREAYEIMSHRCRYDGGTHCGVPYITFNNFRKLGNDEMPQGGAEFCTEGDGYMLLAAAIFADQAMFNGLWMWIHDNRIPHRVRYQDGQVRLPNYEFGGGLPICYALEGSTSENHGSATDGDDDIGMALLIAYKQWGEFMMQDGKPVLDYNGNPISYKAAAEDFLKAFVDTFSYTSINGDGTLYDGGHMSGNIGVDGYVKGGNKGKEVSSWRNTQTTYPDISQFSNISGGGGDGNTHTDYCAPAYYNEFAKWFESGDVENVTSWQIGQYKRAEASSDWLCGQAYSQGLVSSIGTTTMATDGVPVFTNFSEGEDFRTMWRMAQNYLWHGAPEFNWNPKTHQIEEGSNTFEYDMALRVAEMMKEPPAREGTGRWCSRLGASPDPGQPSFFGPSQIKMCYNINGGVLSHYGANYALGCSAPAVVINEDLDLIADLYRQSELTWDDASGESSSLTDDERYIESMPKYFHGWFRCLPLLTYTGNWHAPSDMKSAANMKVYMSVDKTYAYVDDPIDYTVQYRNYGSADATGVKIETEIDPNYEVVSISNGGKFSDGKIVWNIGTVPGFKTGHLAETIDSVSFRVIARDTLNPRICLTSTISGSNFEDWVSNEYPNHATYTMERNCVDILANRTLMIKKTANRTKLNPSDAVTFTVDFSNSSEGGEGSWLNGGRDHVNLSYGNTIMEAYGFRQFYRFWNDAHEAYIDLGNYRMSYFMNDGAAIGLYDAAENPTGWTFQLDNGNDMTKYGWMPEGATTKFTYQKLPNGSDENGKWNQRIMIQFPKTLMATTTHVYDKLDSKYLLHKGGWGPCFFRTVLKTNPAQEVPNRVADDWSYDAKLDIKNMDGQSQIYTLVSPNYADFNNLGYEVKTHSRYACDPLDNDNFDRVLVEEFDGYTWRRIIGRGPLPGREAYDVTIVDTIPYELEWVGWKDSTALKDDNGEKIQATYTPAADPKSAGYTGIVKWYKPTMLVGEEDKLVYMCKARDLGCPDAEDAYYMNVAWISSKTDSPDSSRVELMTTCAELPPQIEPQDALFKSADRKAAEVGDVVAYEVKFKNTLGTSVDVNCKSTENIIKLGNGILPEVGTDGFKLQTKGDGVPFFFAHDHCYGKDGEVYFTVKDGANNQNTFVVFRYESGTPGEANFKGIAMQIMVNKDGNQNFGFYLYDNGTLIDSQGKNWEDSPIQFPGDNKNVKFKFVLNGDKLYMYINDEDDEWTNVLKDWSGLTAAGPGYFGAYVNSNGNANCQLSQFQTNLDYAFDITIGDYLPDELTNITNISDNGTYDETAHSIKWPTFATTTKDAMAPGDSVVYTFDATVEACDNFINNYAYATVYGLDSLKVLNTIECGTTCPIESVVLKSEATEFCVGDSVLFTATAEPEGDYLYEFFLDGESLGEPSDVSEMYFSKEGDYTVRAYDVADAACNMLSKPKALAADSIPPFTLGKDVTVCEGQSVKFGTGLPAGYTFEWSTGSKLDSIEVGESGEYVVTVKSVVCEASDTVVVEVAEELVVDLGGDTVVCETLTLDAGGVYDTYVWYRGAEQVSEESAIEVSESGEYRVEVTQGACGGSGEVSVKVSPATVPSGTFKVSYVVSDTASDGAFGKSLTEQDGLVVDIEEGYVYNWYDADKKPLDGVPTPDVPEGGGDASYTYYVSRTNADGCESELVEVTVTVSGAPVPVAPDVVLCVGDEASALEAAFTDNGGDVTWELRWYDADGNALDGAPVPSSDKAGEAVYYVSQVSSAGAESGKVPVKVTVYGVGVPDVSDIRRQYCEGELLEEMSPVSGADEESFVMGGKFEWSRNGTVTEGTPIVGSKVETTTYGVREYYEVAEGKVCKGEEVLFDVVLTEVAAPSGDLTVNYLKREGADGGFAGLLEQNPGVAKAEDGKTLVWFDADGNELDGVPAPEYSADWAAGEDVVLAYKVAQRDEATGCMSDTLDVTVTISDSPMPKVSPVGYCEGAAAVALTAEVSEDGDGTEYELVWFGVDGGQLDAAPVPDTKAPGEYVYKVAQRSKAEPDNVSSKASLKVTVYALPVLEVDAPDAKCGGNVELSGHVSLKDGSMSVTMGYYKDAEGAEAVRGGLVSESGTYYADASYTINATSEETAVCRSEMVDVKVVINDISGLKVEGPATVCPGGEVVLKASAESSDPGAGEVVYRWSGAAEGEGAELGTGALEGSYGTVYEYEVVAEAGACAGADALRASHKVTVSRGVLDGAVTANGVAADVYRTCGGEVELVSTHSGTDVRWSDASGAALGEGATLTVSPESTSVYVVTLTNVCEASDTVTVSVHPLSAAADWSGLDGSFCEGDDVSAKLSLEGYDAAMSGAYIKWFRDGEELAAFAGSESLSIKGVGSDDAGVYTYRVSNGICERPESADEGALVVVSPASYTKPDGLVVCEGSSADVALKLEDDDVEVAWFDGQKGAEASFALDATSYVRFTLTRPGGCVQNDSVLVTVDSQVELELSADTTICKGESLALEVKASGNGLGYRWELDGEPLGSSPRLGGLMPMESSVYEVTVTSRACEPVRGEVEVEVASLPVIYEIADVKTRTVEVVLAEGYGSSPFVYSVDGGDYVSDPVFTLPRYGRHVYRVSDANGCVGTMAHELEAPSINIPSSFSPGGDGIQDKWEVPELSETYPEATIVIFDRFGKKLVEFKASEGGWDGMYNGKRMPSTDYWYE
ncbi:MAG: T9SS type B sorting domain-containing protein, partial [Paludibacteraceae bacterium]|nr:T9SS type B sorting domain-containing protein [Paludibacteraceae bacterium]